MPPVSVTVITRNEAANVAACLESVTWADEIVVVDSGSTDDTLAIARRFTGRVVSRGFEGYGDQKNHAASLAAYDWVLSIDADERVSPVLAGSIRRTLREEPVHGGFRCCRVARYLGTWIRATDWYPDYQLRLYDRRRGRWNARLVHESVEVDGPVATLDGELLHHAYRDVAHHLATIDRYTTLAARQMYEAGRRAGPLDLALHPTFAFLRNYLLRRGLLAGTVGLIVSSLNAYYVLVKFVKLWELQRERP